jgi:hypothetical protein
VFRSHNEAGFEHIFQLDLPARPQILHRDEPVDEAKWAEFRSPDGRITDSHGLKSLIFRGGIVPAMRPTIWKYMLGYYKWECSDAENEKVWLRGELGKKIQNRHKNLSNKFFSKIFENFRP